MEGVIGYVTLFAGNFAPRTWAFCQGQVLPISQNTALFSILGVTYGGNGQSTFALPDLRGRSVVSQGQGPGLTPMSLGEVGGTESHTMLSTEMPAHIHTVALSIKPGIGSTTNAASPANAVYASGTNTLYSYSSDTNLAPYPGNITTGITGSSTPFTLLNPFLGLNYIICLQGVYPSRN